MTSSTTRTPPSRLSGSPDRNLEHLTCDPVRRHYGSLGTLICPSNAVGVEVFTLAATDRDVGDLLDSRLARFTAINMPAATWLAAGRAHPFGPTFGGYRDILPERLDPALVEEAIRVVPRDVVEQSFVWGTPDQVLRQVADLRDAGLRSICFIPASLHTPRRVFYTFWALRHIAHRLH